MKILVHYPFTDEQHDHLRQIARENGGHEVFVANDDQEALAVASGIDIIVGHFPPAVCAAAPQRNGGAAAVAPQRRRQRIVPEYLPAAIAAGLVRRRPLRVARGGAIVPSAKP